MSKSLEKEYRELMAEDAPDLWDRIEAGLERKEQVADESGLRTKAGRGRKQVADESGPRTENRLRTKAGSDESGPQTKTDPGREHQRRKGFGKYKNRGIAAAACLCLAAAGLSLTVAPFQRRGADGGGSAMNAAPRYFEAEANGGMAGGNMAAEEAPTDQMNGGAGLEDADGMPYDRYEVESPGEMQRGPNEVPLMGQEDAAREGSVTLTIRAKVLEVMETAGERSYTIQVEEGDGAKLSEGDIVTLHDGSASEERLREQEAYLFEIVAVAGMEYEIIAVRSLGES